MEAKIENEKIDITLPGRSPVLGNAHPLNLVKQELEDLFIGLGYQVIEGNDIVDDLYCFERANIPKDHPARDMQDSLYIDQNTLLGTHTTAIQMMVLENLHRICQSKLFVQVKYIVAMMMMRHTLISSCRWKDWLLEKSYSIRP